MPNVVQSIRNFVASNQTIFGLDFKCVTMFYERNKILFTEALCGFASFLKVSSLPEISHKVIKPQRNHLPKA